MLIQERYNSARATSSLKVVASTRYAPTDILIAAGLTAIECEVALLVWDVEARGKTSSKIALIDELARMLSGYKTRTPIKFKGDCQNIAMEVMAWRLYGVCQPCSGLSYQLILGTPVLSDDLCKHCHGAGKVPLPRGHAHTWLVGEIDRLIATAAGVMMNKLATEMDLV
jgi:hypothetical protein